MLSRFAADSTALGHFLDATGNDVRDLRSAMADGRLLAGGLDYLATDEALLVAVAEDLRVRPEAVADVISRHRRSTTP